MTLVTDYGITTESMVRLVLRYYYGGPSSFRPVSLHLPLFPSFLFFPSLYLLLFLLSSFSSLPIFFGPPHTFSPGPSCGRPLLNSPQHNKKKSKRRDLLIVLRKKITISSCRPVPTLFNLPSFRKQKPHLSLGISILCC